MRYLFTTFPATSAMLALVPLAHAAQAAGHEVLVGASGKPVETAARAGLLAVAADDGSAARAYESLVRKVTDPDTDFSHRFYLDHVVPGFGDVGVHLADGLVALGKEWGADAIVYPEGQPGALLAARALGITAVMHGVGTPRGTPTEVKDYLAPTAQRLGVVVDGADADVEIDVSPPSLGRPYDGPAVEVTFPMRYCAYNGGAELDPWVLRRGSRPRVLATLGSYVPGYGVVEGRALREIVLGTAGLGIELVVTTGGFDLPELPSPLPDHVTPVDWVPLAALLPTCDAVIHHGGQNTVHTALAVGVPQLVLPLIGQDAVDAGRIIADRGAGAVLEVGAPAAVMGPAVADLLGDPSYLDASREVAGEMRAMPQPATVVDRLSAHIGAGAGRR